MTLRRQNMLAQDNLCSWYEVRHFLDNRPLFGGRLHGVSAAHDDVRRTDDDISDTGDAPMGIPGPPAVPRAPIQPRARQQRGRKRR